MSKTQSQSMREIVLRPRWTAEDARTVFAAWEESQLPASEFAGRHGFDPQRLYWWRRRLGAPNSRGVFEEVVVRPEPRGVDHEESRLEIVLPHGVVVRVPSSFHEDTLRRVLRAAAEDIPC